MRQIKAFTAALAMVAAMATPGTAQNRAETALETILEPGGITNTRGEETTLREPETEKQDAKQILGMIVYHQPENKPEELDENELIEKALLKRAHKIENCTITYYCPESCCNGSNAWRTASGMEMLPGVTVGVDPDVIPLGSDVMIDYGDGELHYYRADDTGVTGNHVDVLVWGHICAAVALAVIMILLL